MKDIDTAPRTFAQVVYADLTAAELAADVMPSTLFPVVVPFGATR